jgi:hypothetical protein
MPRARPVLVALLLVAAGAVPAAVATGAVSAPVEPTDDPVVGVSENTTRVLLLTEADAAAFREPNASVTNALAAGHASLTNDFELERIDRKLTRADTDAARRAILENATDWASVRLETLEERERTARARFASGDITASEYVLALGTIHAEATHLGDFLRDSSEGDTLYDYADDYDDLQTAVSQLQVQTALLRGPVRERIADVIRGDRERFRLQVTAGNGVMLATLEDDQYVRETVRPENLDAETGGEATGSLNIIFDRYPWTGNHSRSHGLVFRGYYAFDFTADHEHGTLSLYQDSTTEKVYAEYQEIDLSKVPVVVADSATANNTTLNVSRTYSGGPLNVAVENATGAPVDAPVYVNGTEVGTTGTSGDLWTISPAGEYNVTTVRNGTEVELNVTAAPAP